MEEYIVYIALAIVLIIAIVVNRLCDEVFPIIWIIGGIIGLVCGKMNIGIISLRESIISLCSIFCITMILVFTKNKFIRRIGGAIIKGYWMCSVFIGRYIIFAILLFLIYYFVKLKTIKRAEKDKYLLVPLTIPMVHIMALTVAIAIIIMKLLYQI